jgi:hypothetical protein
MEKLEASCTLLVGRLNGVAAMKNSAAIP